MSSAVNGWLISHNSYALVSTTVALVVSWGLSGLLWLIAKKTKNVLLYAMFRMNKIKVLASLPLSKQRLSPPQLFLIIFLILQIFVGSLFSTLLNLVVVSYTSLGVPSTIQSTFVEGLGPLSYLSSGSLARIKNATNSITYGNLAHLFTKSSLMNRGYQCQNSGCSVDIPIDSVCSPIVNVLFNAPASIASSTGLVEKTSIFPDTFWTNFDSIQGATSLFGTYSVNSIKNPTPNNVASYIFSEIYTSTDRTYFFLPLIGTASIYSTYVITWGVKGQKDYKGSVQARNNTLTTTLVDVVDLTFSSQVRNYDKVKSYNGVALCYSALSLQTAQFFCIPGLLFAQNKANGTESLDVIVFGGGKGINSKNDAALLPFTAASFIGSGNIVLAADGTVTSQFFDGSLESKYWNNYQVTMHSLTIVSYNQPATQSTEDISMVMSPLDTFGLDCSAGNSRGLFNPDSTFQAGEKVVIISVGFVASFVIFGLICLIFFIFDDFTTVLTTQFKSTFCQSSDKDIPVESFLQESFIGAAHSIDGQNSKVKVGIITLQDTKLYKTSKVVSSVAEGYKVIERARGGTMEPQQLKSIKVIPVD